MLCLNYFEVFARCVYIVIVVCINIKAVVTILLKLKLILCFYINVIAL